MNIIAIDDRCSAVSVSARKVVRHIALRPGPSGRSGRSGRPSIAVAEKHPALPGRRLGIADTGNLELTPGERTNHGDNTDTAANAVHVDLSLDTLRYYQRVGFMPRVQRLPNGHRRYYESDIEWLELVKCLRETGMPIWHIQHYPELTFTGDETIPERVGLLHDHRTHVVAQAAELEHNLEHLDWKLAYDADNFGVTAGEATP